MIRYYLSYYPWVIEQKFNNSRNNSTYEILLLLRSPVHIQIALHGYYAQPVAQHESCTSYTYIPNYRVGIIPSVNRTKQL